jgi:hypothetical protein
MALATGTYVAGVVSKKKNAMSIHDHQSLSVDIGSVLPSWLNDREADLNEHNPNSFRSC